MHLGVDSSELDAGMKKATDDIKGQMKTVGATLTGVGVAITGSLAMMTKAAVDEEINIKRLATTLKNVGVSYDDVKESLEANITATQKKTGIADNEQRDILNRLILTTGNYQKSLELLPTVLDLAAAGEMDATTAATYLGKAMNDLEAGAEEVSVRFGQASLKFKSMEEIQGRVAGSAEALANPFSVLKATMGDLAEKIGTALLPLLKSIIDSLVPIIEKIQAWITEHPELTKQIVILAAALGGFAIIVGPLLIALPALAAAFAVLTGPIGIAVVAIAAIIAIGVLVWQNWDTIKAKTKEIWGSIVDYLRGVWNTISGFFRENWDKILAILFPAVGLPILIARNWGAITEIVKGIWDVALGWIKAGWNNVISFVAEGVNWLIGQVNRVIKLANKVPGVNLGELGKIGEGEAALPGMAKGGVIPEPTLLYGLKSLRPYAVAGEAGMERVVPGGGYQTANIIIQLDGRTLTQILGQKLVDTIMLKQGLKVGVR